MIDEDPYVMLIASLPRSEALFHVKQPPLSRIRLEKRLRMLSNEDAYSLNIVEGALKWNKFSMATSEQDVIERGREVIEEVNNETLKQLIHERLEIRTVVAALRLRSKGKKPAIQGEKWGYGSWTNHMISNWAESDFKLSGTFPWIKEAKQLIDQNDTLGFERFILTQAYRSLRRHEQQHYFNFEAVVIYVLKWDIFDRWARNNAEAAIARFEHLTMSGLGAYEKLIFKEDVDD